MAKQRQAPIQAPIVAGLPVVGRDERISNVWKLWLDELVTRFNSPLLLGSALADPDADRIPFWDDSASAMAWLTAGTGLTISGTTITAAAPLVVVSQAVAADTATIDFTLTSTYEKYLIDMVDVTVADDTSELWSRISVAGSFKSGASEYRWATVGRLGSGSQIANSSADTKIELISGGADGIGNATGEGMCGQIWICNPASTARFKLIHGHLAMVTAAGDAGVQHTVGFYDVDQSAVDGIRLLPESGNFLTGQFTLYGLKDS